MRTKNVMIIAAVVIALLAVLTYGATSLMQPNNNTTDNNTTNNTTLNLSDNNTNNTTENQTTQTQTTKKTTQKTNSKKVETTNSPTSEDEDEWIVVNEKTGKKELGKGHPRYGTDDDPLKEQHTRN